MTSLSTPVVAPPASPLATGAGAQPGAIQVGYGVSLTDLSAFSQSLAGAPARLEANTAARPGETMQALFRPLEQINVEASSLSQHAQAAMAAGTNLTPGEMVMLTVRCHEFLFHSQLAANAANRTSDGLQQLFRQQS
jgi:hypothetical protein